MESALFPIRRRLFGVAIASLTVFVTFLTHKTTYNQVQTLQSRENRTSTSARTGEGTYQLEDSDVVMAAYQSIDDQSMITNNLDLIRPRPRNLRLVFMGDSVTRYQYLSLAYFLRYGRWFDPSTTSATLNLMNSHSFHHPFHPHEDWNEFFLQSNRMLHPMEACDCYRSTNSSHIQMERRYFRDAERNNIVVYINLNGNETHASWGYYGRFEASDIFASFHRYAGLPFGLKRANASARAWRWQYPTWAEVLKEHVGSLRLDANFGLEQSTRFRTVVLNAGLHSHNFENPETGKAIKDVLNQTSMIGIWKTTTFRKNQLLDRNNSHSSFVHPSDTYMCELLEHCFNISWTIKLREELYFDSLHFSEPVHRILNEDLLGEMQALPSSYVRLNRSSVIRESPMMEKP